MSWYYKRFVKVGRLRIVGDLVTIEIDGDSIHEIPVSDVLDTISNAVEIPINPGDIREIGSLSKRQLGL